MTNRLSEAAFFRLLKQGIASDDVWLWHEPDDFARFLCRTEWHPFYRELLRQSLDQLLCKSYERTFRRFMRIMAPGTPEFPGTVALARGMHSFGTVRHVDELRQLIFSRPWLKAGKEKVAVGHYKIKIGHHRKTRKTYAWKYAWRPAYESYSLNFAYTVENFVLMRRHGASLIAEDQSFYQSRNGDRWSQARRHWLAQAYGWLDERGLRHNRRNVEKALTQTHVGVLIAARVPYNKLKSFGGDSESGWQMEAEMHTHLCDMDCVEAIFALSPESITGARLATNGERKKYSLSKYLFVKVPDDNWRDGYAQIWMSDVGCLPPGGQIVKRITDPPLGSRWYRVG